MNKEQYLSALKRELHANKVEDIDDIVAEYEQHFAHKLSDGFTEEEIAAKLEKPEIIARQFVIGPEADTHKPKGASALAKIGAGFLDFVIILADIILYAFVAVPGAAALGLFAAGVYGIAGGAFVVAIPAMPDVARIFLGVSLLALSLLAAIGTIYYTLFVTQLNRAYWRWHGRVMSGRVGPPLSAAPTLGGKFRRRLRTVALISLLVFVIVFAAAYVILTVSAGAVEFWHVWRWFQ